MQEEPGSLYPGDFPRKRNTDVKLFHVLCTLPNASTLINGVAFVKHESKDGAVITAEPVAESVAAMFESIPGYEISEITPAPAKMRADDHKPSAAPVPDETPATVAPESPAAPVEPVVAPEAAVEPAVAPATSAESPEPAAAAAEPAPAAPDDAKPRNKPGPKPKPKATEPAAPAF